MLKLFRRIRRKLIKEGNLKRYLVYAIGEIFLVVIGILIALQLNNLNEGKKEALKEYEILLSLQEDFNSNLVELENTLKTIPKIKEGIMVELGYVGISESLLSDEMKNEIRNNEFAQTNIFNGTLTSILSSEKLEIINSDSLKKLLTTYPAYVNSFTRLENSLEDYVRNVQRPILRKHLTLADHLPQDNERTTRLLSKVKKSDHEALLNNREYQNVLIGIWIQNNKLFDSCRELKTKTKEINRHLIKEISLNRNHKEK